MDRPALLRIDHAAAVDGRSGDIDHSAERFLPDRHGDRRTCVHCRHAARQTIRCLHGNTAHVPGAEMLECFERIDFLADRDFDRVEDVGDCKIVKMNIDYRTSDPLDDPFGAFRHGITLSFVLYVGGFAKVSFAVCPGCGFNDAGCDLRLPLPTDGNLKLGCRFRCVVICGTHGNQCRCLCSRRRFQKNGIERYVQ